MTDRQKRLIKFLKDNGRSSVWTICSNLSDDYNYSNYDASHDRCVTIRKDAEEINASDECDEIIIHDRNYNYWIASNSDELNEFLNPLYKKAFNTLKKCKNIIEKAEKNNQFKFTMDGDGIRMVKTLSDE